MNGRTHPARSRLARITSTAWWRPVVTGVLLGSAIATGLLAAAQQDTGPTRAGSPPGCRGAHCTGKDPESQGCTHAEHGPVTVVEHSPAGKVRMDIRYSRGCDASWARVWLADVGTRIELRSPQGDFQEATIDDRHDAQGYVYTPMLGGHPNRRTEACFHPPDTASGERGSPRAPVCFTPGA
ncbi:DUF2690 domain-containing protein [Streptomyces triticagri]|uniref:DUF2690 domain-containing protein n=1 Tax=Streptomyces triticagri TaxID=2293568 RepID=A0A372M0F3_9ACTN|nr:DUF2690 domain-containing protein [Streptomyces triticagri]RFU83767.1 DUF2690 domain-containing protein [Streptomyces triticagri]